MFATFLLFRGEKDKQAKINVIFFIKEETKIISGTKDAKWKGEIFRPIIFLILHLFDRYFDILATRGRKKEDYRMLFCHERTKRRNGSNQPLWLRKDIYGKANNFK